VQICRSVLRVQLKITPEFAWHDRAHGGSLRWHLWVEDSDSETIYHTEVNYCYEQRFLAPACFAIFHVH